MTLEHGSWCLDPGTWYPGAWFMVHGSWCCAAWILVPRPRSAARSRCPDHPGTTAAITWYPGSWIYLAPLDHGSWCNTLGSACIGSWCPGSWIMLPWCMVHEPIPWVLVALDPGTWCPGSWIMGQYPGFWLRLVLGIFWGVDEKSLF